MASWMELAGPVVEYLRENRDGGSFRALFAGDALGDDQVRWAEGWAREHGDQAGVKLAETLLDSSERVRVRALQEARRRLA